MMSGLLNFFPLAGEPVLEAIHLKKDFPLGSVKLFGLARAVHAVEDTSLALYAGQMVEGGPTEEVIQRPRHPYTQLLLSEAPDPDTMGDRQVAGNGEVEATAHVRGEPPSLINPPAGCRFHPRCPHAMPICSQHRPACTDLGGGHWTHCFLYSEQETPGVFVPQTSQATSHNSQARTRAAQAPPPPIYPTPAPTASIDNEQEH